MSIHSEIKRLRLHLGWSHQRLAEEVSKAEGLKKTLAWQTVQQWEREPNDAAPAKSTAPARRRLEIVARLLGTTVNDLMAGQPASKPAPPPQPSSVDSLSPQEAMLIAYARLLDNDTLARLVTETREKAAAWQAPKAAKSKLQAR